MSKLEQPSPRPGPTTNPPAAQVSDGNDAERFGYRQDLRRTLRFFAVFGVSFSIISITTGIFLNFGVAIDNWGPAAIWLWPAVGAGQLLVALVVAELSTRIPLAGYAYQWSSRLVNSTYGWFVGFAGLMNMTIGGGSIALLAASPLLLSEFGENNPSGHLVLTVAVILMVLPVAINIISVQLATRVNTVAVITEIIGTVVFGVLLFVLWGVKAKPSHHGFGFLGNTTGLVHHPTWYAVVLAGLLGAYTIAGFEFAADMAEESVNARYNVPRAIILAVAGSVVLGMVALIGFTVAIPQLATTQQSSLPLVTIAHYWLTSWVVKVLIGFVIFSMFSINVVIIAAQSRLVYSMARDNMIPMSGFFRKVNHRTQTPIGALVVFGVIDIGFMFYGYLQTNSFNTLVGATAILPFIIYFMITLAYAIKRRVMQQVTGAFSLGRFAPLVIGLVLAWTLALIAALSLPSSFHGADKVVGGAAVVAALWYITVLRRRLKHGRAGVRPIEEMLDEG